MASARSRSSMLTSAGFRFSQVSRDGKWQGCADAEKLSAKSMAPKLKARSCLFICVLSRLSNDFGRPRQHLRRNRQADLLGRLEVDKELKLRGLLHRQISGFSALQ